MYAYYGVLVALQSMVITKQPQIGGEGDTLAKLDHAPDLTLFPDREPAYDRFIYSPGTQRLVSKNLLARPYSSC